MSNQQSNKISDKEIKLIECNKLKIIALTKTGSECLESLNKLKLSIQFLVKEDGKFIDFMFAKIWESKFFEKKGDHLLNCYLELLDKLLSADINHYERAIKFFIDLFLGNKLDEFKNDDKLSKIEQRIFPRIHHFLKKLRSKFLIVQSNYLDLILNKFPFTTECTIHSFVCYFSNCSSIYLYEDEENRERVLWRLIERLININSYLQKNQQQKRPTIENSIKSTTSKSTSNKSTTKSIEENNQFMNRLFEAGLSAMFKFINKISLKGDLDLNELITLNDLRDACNKNSHKQLFESLTSIFLQQVIKMDNSTSVNLIILYVCSLNEELCFKFLDSLWTEAFEISNPKLTSVNYFCSFLCTAKFLSINTLVQFMIKVAKKINHYLTLNLSIEDDLNNFHRTIKKHKYFYSMCNCLFNLVCIRSDEFTDKHIYQLTQLQIQTIITSSLNPLAVCPIEIVKQFANICKFYELGLCNMIIQRNRRIGLLDLLKKNEVKFKLVYPFQNLHCNYDKLSLVYKI